MMPSMKVYELKPGSIFKAAGRSYELIKIGTGSAVVRYVNSERKVEIRDDDGEVASSFMAPGRVVTIGLTTVVDDDSVPSLAREAV